MDQVIHDANAEILNIRSKLAGQSHLTEWLELTVGVTDTHQLSSPTLTALRTSTKTLPFPLVKKPVLVCELRKCMMS